jgi:hypothetical protein
MVLNFFIKQHSLMTILKLSQRIKNQKRLMWRSLVTLFPNVQIANDVFQLIRIHNVSSPLLGGRWLGDELRIARVESGKLVHKLPARKVAEQPRGKRRLASQVQILLLVNQSGSRMTCKDILSPAFYLQRPSSRFVFESSMHLRRSFMYLSSALKNESTVL